mmetsp:Transcript_18281/g.21097  ORF Transcript_18281/g.21097 Transcript_18281/m.21097 type:complete len:288 (+) Transcript_18281:30-893(+)
MMTSGKEKRRQRNNNCCKSIQNLIILLLFLMMPILTVSNDNYEDELLRELLEEERRVEEERMKESGYQYSEDYIQKQQEEIQKEEELRREQEEQMMEAQRERIRQQREKEFDASLARMNEEQQKAAKKQKKNDASIVKRILKASSRGNHYAVLGLFNFEWKIGPIKLFRTNYKIGPFTLFRPSTKNIKKAYRNRAMRVHPDKNRDGRAQEAFVVIEESATVLTDKGRREQYDLELKLSRIEQRERIVQNVQKVLGIVQRQISAVVWVFKNIFGPFALPILLLTCLII